MPDTDDEVPAEEIEVGDDLAQRLLDAQQAYDEVKEYLDNLKDEVKASLAGKERVTGTCGGQPVFNFTRYTTTRVDSARLRREWPDIYAQYTRTRELTRLAVVRPKAES